jgi:hypothetical protein
MAQASRLAESFTAEKAGWEGNHSSELLSWKICVEKSLKSSANKNAALEGPRLSL